MLTFLQNKVVLVIVIGLAVAGAAWYGLTSPANDTSLITTTGTAAGPGQELVETLLALRAVNLDGAVFAQTSFAGLVDFATPIIPEPVGRPNPFAPLQTSSSTTNGKDGAIFAPAAGSLSPGKGRTTR